MESSYNLRYTKAATKDLEKIMDYLAGYGNPNIMINLQKEIDRKTASVIFQPYINMAVLKLHGYDFRRIIIKGYIFIYYIDEDSKDVLIFRIFHELEDYENKLGK